MPLALVLGGGNALAAYDAGAFEAMAESGLQPDHLAGASAGAITAVLIAGNPPERRIGALRAFWEAVASPGSGMGWITEEWRRLANLANGMQARLFGRPGMFHPRADALLDANPRPSLYDLSPLRRTLGGLVDLGLLNDGPIRVSLLAVDLETGEEVVFDNRACRIGLDHVLASSALLPNFAPVEVGGRLLVDGGLAANAPAHLVLDPPRDGLTCFVIDPFPLAAGPPSRLLQAQQRQEDLIFASQTRRTLAAMARIWSLEGDRAGDQAARGAVWRLEYHPDKAETAIKSFDFGCQTLKRRWRAGHRDMGGLLAAWDGEAPTQPGLFVSLGDCFQDAIARQP